MRLDRQKTIDILTSLVIATGLLVLLWWALAGCASLKRSALVGGGAGAGAAVGTLVGGPGLGTIGGAVVGGTVSSAVVDGDRSEQMAKDALDLPRREPTAPAPEPPWYDRIPWWAWLIAQWIFLRRAHILDAVTGHNPRFDAILRALGIRTHKTPILPKRKGGSP